MGSHEKGNASAQQTATKDEEKQKLTAGDVALGVAAVAGVALFSWIGYKLFGGPESSRETMVAPGRRPNRMFRDEFERDPSSYFRNLRNSNHPFVFVLVPPLNHLYSYSSNKQEWHLLNSWLRRSTPDPFLTHP
ncbi:unnamed protein product [Cuscuta epithymum]|uniref:Mitochondrial import inner membrane translocase subunit Tim21 n=1 Tax=Cuscuta epithymum TaxID=186058 RepID=A0AAV0DAJ1_9ASTE|nr:unnamed protein product [Cuscuta epithymum]